MYFFDRPHLINYEIAQLINSVPLTRFDTKDRDLRICVRRPLEKVHHSQGSGIVISADLMCCSCKIVLCDCYCLLRCGLVTLCKDFLLYSCADAIEKYLEVSVFALRKI